MVEIPPVRQFITEDEIDANLAGGSLVSGSKGRIFAFFQQPYSDRERVDFLKQEYGTADVRTRCPMRMEATNRIAERGYGIKKGVALRCVLLGKKSPDESPG